jgi:hypothetical protein
MSKATRQACTLLSVIGGCMYEMHRKHMFSVVKLHEHTLATYKLVVDILDKWPDTGDTRKNLDWCMARVEIWKSHLRSDDEFYVTTLAAICEQCLADLRTITKDKYKTKLLDKLVEPVERVHRFMDPYCENIIAYDEASRLMRKLYELIEWPWK